MRDDRRKFKEVCDKLNIGDGWRYLHEKLKENIPSLNTTTTRYKRHNHGGGSAALCWLKAVTTEKVKISGKDELFEITLKHFIATALNFDRGDIVSDLKLCKVKFLKDLSLEKLENLSQMLDEDVQGIVKGWRDFASDYGYKYDRIRLLEKQNQTPNSYDPTHILLTDVLTINEDFTLKEFVKCLQDIGRNDIVNIVKKFEDKKQQERETSEKNGAIKSRVAEQPNTPKSKTKKQRRGRKNKKTIVRPDSEISDCGGEREQHGREHPVQPHQPDEPSIMVQAAQSDLNGRDNVATVFSQRDIPLYTLHKAPVNLHPEDLQQTLPPNNDQTQYAVDDNHHKVVIRLTRTSLLKIYNQISYAFVVFVITVGIAILVKLMQFAFP